MGRGSLALLSIGAMCVCMYLGGCLNWHILSLPCCCCCQGSRVFIATLGSIFHCKVYLDLISEPYSRFTDVRKHANQEQSNEGNAVATTNLEDVLYYIKDIQAAFFFRSKFVPWRFGR